MALRLSQAKMQREAEATAAEAAPEAAAAGATGGARLPALRSSLKRSAKNTPVTAAPDTPASSPSVAEGLDAAVPTPAEKKKKEVSAGVKAVRAAPLMREHDSALALCCSAGASVVVLSALPDIPSLASREPWHENTNTIARFVASTWLQPQCWQPSHHRTL